MRTSARVLGTAAIGLGLLIALFPLISISRLSQDVLDQLPDMAPEEFSDDRHRFALADDDFLLATRTYQRVSVAEIEAALRTNGFAATHVRGQGWYAKPCCGTYDAVLVGVTQSGDGTAIVTLTAADSDIQLTWPFIVGLGAFFVLGGVATILMAGVRHDLAGSHRDSVVTAGEVAVGAGTS